MAYDRKTYGKSPFGNSAATTDRAAAKTEALSDQVGDQLEAQESNQRDEALTEGDAPALPADYAAAIKPSGKTVSFFYIPEGRITGLNMLGETLGWLMAWGTVGFFRAYVPAPVLLLFDKLFNPWGMASITFISALITAHLLRRLQHKLSSLRRVTTTALEYGNLNHHADAQKHVYELMSTAEEKTDIASRWLVSWLTALACLFIIGSFY